MAKRTWYTYHFKRGNKILHGGRTEDPTRREGELQRELDAKGRLKIAGGPKTEQGAKDWEDEHGFS